MTVLKRKKTTEGKQDHREPVVSDSGDREGLAAAMSVLNGMSTYDWDH